MNSQPGPPAPRQSTPTVPRVSDRNFLTDAMLAFEVGELILVRHGQQATYDDVDPERKHGADNALSDLGERQALVVADTLAHEHVDAVYSSDMRRAVATAVPIAAAHGLAFTVVPDLFEIVGFRDMPAGMNVLDFLGPGGFQAMTERFAIERRWDVMPHSETSARFRGRVRSRISHIVASHGEHERVVIVCHGGVINAIVADVLGSHADMISYMSHASITRIVRGQGRLMLRALNQDQHLRDAGLHSM